MEAKVGNSLQKPSVGFVGLGTMGAPMALNLLKAGYSLSVLERKSLPLEIRKSTQVYSSLPALASASDVVILMLPDTSDVSEVLFGPGGIAEAGLAGRLIVDMSSISPSATKEFAVRLKKSDCDHVDAPVSGGQIGAVAGSLTIMAGGSAAAFARALPLLQAMGKSITHIGESNGSGQACKIANQMIVAMNIQAVAEALALMKRCDADLTKVREALLGGFAGSRVLDVHGKRMIDRTFDPGFRIELHRKDLNLALNLGRETMAHLPGTEMVEKLFERAVAGGGAAWDHSALIKIAEESAAT